ncbi:MAG: histone deacetylase family protein [Pseudomonadota bacterium]
MMPGHAERPDRLRAIASYLTASGLLGEFSERETTPVDDVRLSSIHDAGYLKSLEALAPEVGIVAVDPDTALGPASLTAAGLATGAVVDAVTAVLAGEAKTAFCAVRPPGHHAEHDAAMGFCFYNSIAIGADAALAAGLKRVAILDFDVHHGNGTVEIMQDRPEVLVCSSFQHPYYPHRYFDLERPHIVNTPLPAGTGSAAFREAIERDWLPALEAHQPELVLVSAGFDAHQDDPLAGLKLTEDDFRWITTLILEAAAASAEGRVVSALEGGYDLNALARSVGVHLEVLAGA